MNTTPIIKTAKQIRVIEQIADIGTYADRIGGVDTNDLHILVNVAQGALFNG